MLRSALLNVMVAAARKAARSLKRDFGEVEHLQVSLKGPANFVSAADRKAEQILRTELAKARPGYGFLGEEGGRVEGSDATHTWIVDPLDGTTNFRKRLSDAVIACGLPHLGRGDLDLFRREFAVVQEKVAGLRRFGAASLDLAWVAAGRLDAYWERDLSPWDMAAGLLLVREAGGFATDLDGDDAIFAKSQIAAGNETIHRELLGMLRQADKA
jgi:myo-inositol-1(or 4)-monophosphatase